MKNKHIYLEELIKKVGGDTGREITKSNIELFNNLLHNVDSYLRVLYPEKYADSHTSEVMKKTPYRVLKAWSDFATHLASLDELKEQLTTFPTKGNVQKIEIHDIEIGSLCEHHLFPILGTAKIEYLCSNRMFGLSKLPRIIQHFTTRPTTQEDTGEDIVSFLYDEFDFVTYVKLTMTAKHTCMCCRGVKARNAATTTVHMRGNIND